MRGTLWSFITMLVLAIEIAAVSHVIYGAFDESASLNTILNGEHVSGIINMLQSSPSGTSYDYTLPRGRCGLRVRPASATSSIRAANAQINYSSDFTFIIDENSKSKINAAYFESGCSSVKEKHVFFKKCGNEIRVSLDEILC